MTAYSSESTIQQFQVLTNSSDIAMYTHKYPQNTYTLKERKEGERRLPFWNFGKIHAYFNL